MAGMITLNRLRFLQRPFLWQVMRNGKMNEAFMAFRLDVLKRNSTGKMKVEAMPSKGGEKMVRIKL